MTKESLKSQLLGLTLQQLESARLQVIVRPTHSLQLGAGMTTGAYGDACSSTTISNSFCSVPCSSPCFARVSLAYRYGNEFVSPLNNMERNKVRL